MSSTPAAPGEDHLQLTSGSTIIAARDTLADWNAEEPMCLVDRAGQRPAQQLVQPAGRVHPPRGLVTDSPLLTTLVSLIPPLPYVPPIVRGTFTALILVVRGQEQAKYMGLATTDPVTGQPRHPNVVSQPDQQCRVLGKPAAKQRLLRTRRR